MKWTFHPKRSLLQAWEQLRHLRDAPHALAGGVAIGIFWGFTPLTGVKTLLSILTAWILRCSKIPAVLAVAFHDILLPVWPIVLRWEYQIGYWLLHRPHEFPPKLVVRAFRWSHLLQWKTLDIVWTTCVGSVVIALPCALLSYLIVEKLLERYEASHHRHLTPPP